MSIFKSTQLNNAHKQKRWFLNFKPAGILRSKLLLRIVEEVARTHHDPSGNCIFFMKWTAFEIHASMSSFRWPGYKVLKAAKAWTAAEVHSTYLKRNFKLLACNKLSPSRLQWQKTWDQKALMGNQWLYPQMFQLDLSTEK